MRVLFCTDGSKISYNTLRNFSLWSSKETTIDVICVIDWSFLPNEAIIEDSSFVNNCTNIADNILYYSEKLIRDSGLIFGERIKHCGSAVESILEQLKEGYDLVLLGSHGKKGIQSWLGSVSRETLQASVTPTYISKDKNEGKKVLFTTDGSKISKQICEKAIGMIELNDKEIYICTVMESPDLLFLEGSLDTNWMMTIQKQQEQYATKALEELKGTFLKHNYYVKDSKILEGIPAQSILDYSKENACDLIIMGSKSKTKMQGFLLGSISKRVVENTKSDTLVIKIKD